MSFYAYTIHKDRSISSYTGFMRYVVIVALLLAIFIIPTHAQTVFNTGVWKFVNYLSGEMTYTGTWVNAVNANVIVRTTSTPGASVSFLATGKVLILNRLVYNTATPSRYNVCVGVSCTAVVSETGASQTFWYAHAFPLANGTNTVTITQTSGTVTLDYIMILADPTTAGMPTAVPTVPTATILPSSTPAPTATPAFTATPGDTPVPTATILPSSTPAPTATPYELPAAIWAIDPAVRYGSSNGQITATRYEMAAPDYLILFLLSAILGVNCVAVGLAIWRRK